MNRKKVKKILLITIPMLLAIIAVTLGIVFSNISKKNEYVTITYEVNGGSYVENGHYLKGEKVTLPNITKENKVFRGWYYDIDFSNKCENEIIVEKDITLFARFGIKIILDANGGVSQDAIIIDEDGKLDNLSSAYKDGYIFSGWFYDKECNRKVWETDVTNKMITLYAGYSKEAVGIIKRLKSVKNVNQVPQIEIYSPNVVLHDENLSDYIYGESASGEAIYLICRPSKEQDYYIITTTYDLAEGENYFIKTRTSNISFSKVDEMEIENADELTLTIKKEEREVIKKNPSIHIKNINVAKFEENVYTFIDQDLEKEVNRITIRTDKTIQKDDLLTIGQNDYALDNDYICKVISSKKERLQYVIGTEIFEDIFVIIDVITPNVDDIYAELDVYGNKEAILDGIIELSEETLLQNLEENEGIEKIKTSIVNSLYKSKSIIKYAENIKDIKEKEAFMSKLANFSFQRPKVKIDISGTVLAFEIELSGTLQIKNFKIEVSVVIKNRTEVNYNYTICKSRKITLNPLLWFYTNVQVNLSNDFSISLEAKIEFADSDDTLNRIDISDEIKEIIDLNKDAYNKFTEAITESPLFEEEGSELEYVDIFNIQLGAIPLPLPVVSVQIEFNVVGSLGARAGLYIEFNHHYVESTTLTNGTGEFDSRNKPVMYDSFKFTRVTTENEIDIAITLKGQVGFRCGLEARLSLSILQLNSVAAVYVSFRFGPYIEISGLVSFRYSYDAVRKISATQVYGGIYLEVGLFVNAKLGAKFLVYDINTDLFDTKIKLYDVGDRLIPLEFVEKSNSPSDPYIITGRYSGVNMRNIEMRYLDIVTGERVIDRATNNQYGGCFDYKIEFVDNPDYQTEDYQKYVRLAGGQATHISRDYQVKSLKFVVKLTLLPKSGIMASGIERIVYMEYYNANGRDLVTRDSKFVNEYETGYGTKFSEIIDSQAVTEGEYVTPPITDTSMFPKRHGYYLDINDLWEKYYPHLGDKVDEGWDGKFGKARYDDPSTTYYRLKWKLKTYKGNFYVPNYTNSSNVDKYQLIGAFEMNYVPALQSFIVYTEEIRVPTIEGKKYIKYENTKGLSFTNNYYVVDSTSIMFSGLKVENKTYPIVNVDKTNSYYINGFNENDDTFDFYARYEDTIVYTETFVLETTSTTIVKKEYRPFDYQGKDIRPLPPQEFEIGKEFILNDKTYVITGYRDINNNDYDNNRYYNVGAMPNVDKNRIYYVLYERKGLSSLPVYYVNIKLDGKHIGSFPVKEGETINYEVLKINFDDKMILSNYLNYPRDLLDKVLNADYEIAWPNLENYPKEMPKKDFDIEVMAKYSYQVLTAKFILDNPLQSFTNNTGVTIEDGKTILSILGKMWNYGQEDEDAYYFFPTLNDYFDVTSNKFYTYIGWQNDKGEIYYANTRMAFTSSVTYTPLFKEGKADVIIYFMNYSDYGYEYYEHIIKGDYYGKTLREVIEQENIELPNRIDANGKWQYTFLDWGVDIDNYIIGSEKNLNGGIKRTLTFKANYQQEKKKYTITFDAVDGLFSDGKQLYQVTDEFDKIIKLNEILPNNYQTEAGTFVFAYWTTRLYDETSKITSFEIEVGTNNLTYYAYYILEPATITLNFKGKVKTSNNDGTGLVYFNNNKALTTLTVEGTYGTSYYLLASMFKVDVKSKTYLPSYLKWTVNGIEYISEFYNDNYMARIPFDHNVDVEIIFMEPTIKEVTITFISDGKCYDINGNELEDVYCQGVMGDLRHFTNYTQNYGTTIKAPNVYYYSENYYVFNGFVTTIIDENGIEQQIKVKPGEEITFEEDRIYTAVYLHDTTSQVELIFKSEPYSGVIEDKDKIDGLMIFPDGSVEIQHFGTNGEKINFQPKPKCNGKTFIGWTTDGKNLITSDELKEMVYEKRTTYYAVYEDNTEGFSVIINSGIGKFIDGTTQKKVLNVPFGTLTIDLEKPIYSADNLIFSHYETKDGVPVTAIENDIEIYACYGVEIKDFEGLKKVNEALNANYVLTKDIIIGKKAAYGNFVDLIEWESIGRTSIEGFSGKFNGNGHVIRFNSKVEKLENFGLFSKVSGMVYNLYVGSSFSYKGNLVKEEVIGTFVKEVTEKGRIIDCASMQTIELSITTNKKITIGGSIGINYGLIDGLFSSMNGTILLENDGLSYLGSVVGSNYGTIKNTTQTGRNGNVAVVLPRSPKTYIGNLCGYNCGLLENSFVDRAIHLSFTDGSNRYLNDSVQASGIVGLNEGLINECTFYNEDFYCQISDVMIKENKYLVTLEFDKEGKLEKIVIYLYEETSQGPMYIIKYIIYLDENAVKSGLDHCEEYTYQEFASKYPDIYNKIKGIDVIVNYNQITLNQKDGKTNNVYIVNYVGTGNITALASSCNYDEIKWSYLRRLYAINYYK